MFEFAIFMYFRPHSIYTMYPHIQSGIHFGSIYVHEPGSLVTNIFILLMSIFLVYKLRRFNGPWINCWRVFLACLGIASAGGIFTHGFPTMFTEAEFYLVWGIKNSFVPIGNLFACLALIDLIYKKGLFNKFFQLVFALKSVVVVALMFYQQSFVPVVVDLGITYVFVMAFTYRYRRSIEGMGVLFSAFLIAFLSGFLYLFPWHLHAQWFTNSDAVHLFVLVSMFLIYKGATEVLRNRLEPVLP